jgi:hypothetical protein
VVPFTLPSIAGRGGWRRLLDTTDPELAEDATVYPSMQPFSVQGRSLVLFIRQRH